MADDFDAGICSGNWWNTARNTGFNASGMAGPTSSVSGSLTDTPIPISTFRLSPTHTVNWSQSLLSRSSSERDETSFHDMLQEPVNYFQPVPEIQMNQEHFLMGQPQQSEIFPVIPQESIYNQLALNNYLGSNYQAGSNDSIANFTQLLNSSPPKQQQSTIQYPSPPPLQFATQRFEQKHTKPNMDSSSTEKSSSEASLKKPRIETPSPLPTFKVRKEKLGDRITALQQLVSPFGKTDTASVLHEAIEYIKFLHDQVNVLSTPYLKNGHPMQHQQDGEGMKKDLRSRGLCLVPMESIYPVATETTADFWTPTFGGTYR